MIAAYPAKTRSRWRHRSPRITAVRAPAQVSRSIIRAENTFASKRTPLPAWCGTPISRRFAFRRARADVSFRRFLQRVDTMLELIDHFRRLDRPVFCRKFDLSGNILDIRAA